MYNFLLNAHSGMRWLVLMAAAYLVYALLAKVSRKQLKTASTIFVGMLDMQLLLGIGLAFTSPLVKAALGDMGTAMSQRATRFMTVEHEIMMVAAIVVAHIGNVKARKAHTDQQASKTTMLYMGIALILVLAAIPWSRPLF